MTLNRYTVLFGLMALLILLDGMLLGTWNSALGILNFALLSAIMALGVNIQWGYAGLFNVGIVGFVALGGLAPVLISTAPVPEAWEAGGPRLVAGLALGGLVIVGAVLAARRLSGRARAIAVTAILIGGFFLYRAVLDPAVTAIESFDPATHGNIGGLGLPVLLSWPVAALMAAGAAWIVGKTALGLRSDYLAIATLGIGEIIVAVMRNEDWLARGVKLINDIPRPVPYEVELQRDPGFLDWAAWFGTDPVVFSTIIVKLCWTALFVTILLALVWLSERALHSPWGRMMRAIRDNETAAEAMGKDVTGRHLQIFILGSAICGLAGAMLVTQDGLLNPGTYNPLRYTFLIWVMVIVGGSGNNWGSIIGAFLIWYLWTKLESWGPGMMGLITDTMADGPLKSHLVDMAAHVRVLAMGIVLLLVLRFSPRGLLPGK